MAQSRSRKPKKPLAEIEAATEVLVNQGRAAQQALFKLIMTVEGLSKPDRDALMLAANLAIGESIAGLGFQVMLLRHKLKLKAGERARTGNATKAALWHDLALALAHAHWDANPVYRDNFDKTAQQIHENLTAGCQAKGIAAPRAGTVAKFLARQ